ncbi:unnamed protein product [Enterobius vermicularis]|uniref:MFS domain-containing protein n=1 Tax=Enterobius vermicularis TaxID=51028 RepID=A0A0N4VMJ4_ENTVE|nr:unnamed protein product [Enterobius vermicularis]
MISKRQAAKLFAICILLTITTNFPSGFTNSSINTAVEELRRFINESYSQRDVALTEVEQTLIRSGTLNCWYIMQVFGYFFAPFLTDRYGRKVAYLTATTGMLTAACLQYLATLLALPELLVVGRSLCAFCSPISDASLLLYLQECSPLEMRGAFSFLCEIGYGSMCLLGMVLGMRTVLGDSLSRLLGTSIIPQLFFISCLIFIPETPKYLMITKNNRSAALKSLKFFQGERKEHENLLDEYAQEALEEGNAKRSSIREVITVWHLRQAVILGILVVVLTLSFFPVLQSSTYFFIKANIANGIAELSSTLLMLMMSMSSVTGTFLVDRFPRRKLLFLFASLQMLFLLLFVITSTLSNSISWLKYACLASMGSFIIVYSMVVGPMSWFIASELVPQRHRSTVFCLCFTVGNILIAATNFVSIPLYEVSFMLKKELFYLFHSNIALSGP